MVCIRRFRSKMNILEILKTQGKSLSALELDSYRNLLLTGGYDKKMVQEGLEILCSLKQELILEKERKKVADGKRGWPSQGSGCKPKESQDNQPLDYVKNVSDYFKKNRSRPDYKSHFRKYIAESDFFREDFIGQNISLFTAEELNIILSVIQLSETFLEKFFKSFDPEKISKYQEFSEEFFIKHINELKIDIVLKEGRNPWRRKEVMSKKLLGMLRLKGVRL